MMPAGKLARMVVANTLRSPRHFILSAFGIVIGIGAFVLFLALTQRAGSVIEKVFPLEEVQAAHRMMEEDRHFGKIVLRVGS